MSTSHPTISHTSGPSPLMGRANLIGRHLRRDLSFLLVFTLLLLSAITFSTEKIPNFKPDCQTHQAPKEKNRTTVAVVRTSPRSTTITPRQTIQEHPHSATPTPVQEIFSFPASSRAPPLFTIHFA